MKLSVVKPSNTMPAFVKNCVLLLLFIAFSPCWGQAFTVSAVKTDETCNGNGTLTLSVQNTDASATSVNYKVFKLPDTTTAVHNSTSPNVPGLQDGNYLVVATQLAGTTPIGDPATLEITINNLVSPVTYSITGVNAVCGNDGKMTINITGGNPVTYEILTGPVTIPPQASNVFENIPAGNYTIRVNDICNDGYVVAYTLFSDGPVLAIAPGVFPDSALPACNLLTAQNTIAAVDGTISYPLTLVMTVYPPDGTAPVVYNSTIQNGDPAEIDVSQVIPFYYDTPYNYTLVVTDGCGIEYTIDNPVDVMMTAFGAFGDAGCGKKNLQIIIGKYLPPFTIEFTETPPGLDLTDFNPIHPGPFSESVIYYTSEDESLPFGVYTFKVTDACGNEVISTHELTEPTIPVEPIYVATNNDCLTHLGTAQVSIAGFTIEFAEIISGPAEYSDAYPVDVTAFISEEDGLLVSGLPPGTYYFVVTDTCGTTYEPLEVIVPDFSSSNKLSPVPRPDCELGFGTIKIANVDPNPLLTMIITFAPASFPEPLPYDVSFNIDPTDGAFYMDNLPPGTYTFKATTACNPSLILPASITAYSVTANEFVLSPHCGSFDLYVKHTSTGVAFAGFWLQRKNEVTGKWEHPETGVEYVEGTPPEVGNSYILGNNTTNFSLIMPGGEYRVLKSFQTWASGTQAAKICIEELYEFTYYDHLEIAGIEIISCSGEVLADVMVNVVGAPPFTYTITEKNNLPFVIANGENNVFEDLESALYLVEVTDDCGEKRQELFNIADLPTPVFALKPDDLTLCDEGDDNVEIFDLASQTPDILGTQDAEDVTLTYHASLAEAEAGTNALALSHNSGPATIHVRVVKNNNPACIAYTSFDLILSPKPQLDMKDTWGTCEGESVIITADSGYVRYEWSTGATTQAIVVNKAGSYTVTAWNSFNCSATKTIQVTESPLPYISHIDISDWTDNDNVITVVMEPTTVPASFEYSLDGINYQDSPVFTNLGTGEYTIYVRDQYDCGADNAEAYILTYPKFFTPNGDGVNETWRIKFSALEPDLIVYIYDRYGKIITGFGANSPGWDGTLNGAKLPSTDYWFVVKRQNGQELKGHFSMIR